MIITKLKKLREVSSCRKMSPEKLAAFRDERLRQIIGHAYKTVPFYRELMDKTGIKPGDIKTEQDLVKLPLVTKQDIQANYERCVSEKFTEDQCLVRTTSGSSGKMLKVLWETDSFWNRLAMYYRCLNMIGYTPFKKILYFLPVPEKSGFTFGLFRQIGLEPKTPFEEIRKTLLKFKPHVLAIYPSYALDLADFLTSKDIKKAGIEAISLNSEMILPHDRAEIERKFKCPAYDEYSSVEMGFIASMCKKRNNHVFTDNVILEILDQQGHRARPGERGEIVLTSLTNYAMPFIRYRIGDYSYFPENSTCTCGLPFPVMGPVEGRKDDSFVLDDGTVVAAWKIYDIVERPLEEFGMNKVVLTDFYIVQRSSSTADFYYVKGPDFNEDYLTQLKKGIDTLFDKKLTVSINSTDNIDRVKTVKRKYIHREI